VTRGPVRVAVALALAAGLVGCMGVLERGQRSEFAEIIRASAKDDSSWCFTVNLMTPWGSESTVIARSAIPVGTTTCDKNGLTVKSEAATVGIPMTIVPQFQIGPPTLTPAPVPAPRLVPRQRPEPHGDRGDPTFTREGSSPPYRWLLTLPDRELDSVLGLPKSKP